MAMRTARSHASSRRRAAANGTLQNSGHGRASPGRDAADERGRHAERPSEIPKRGWKDILWRVYGGLGEDRILMNAAGVTFYALLALFPAIAAFVSIYGLFADPSRIADQLDTLAGLLPGGGMEVIRDQLTRVASQSNGSLTLGVIIGLLCRCGAPMGA